MFMTPDSSVIYIKKIYDKIHNKQQIVLHNNPIDDKGKETSSF